MWQLSNTAGLFENFEVNREPFWPRVGWLLAGSIAWHLFAVFVIVSVPQVRDTLRIASIFSDSNIVDRPYDKTEIENLGVITEITNEKFHYPEGYFQMANGEVPFPSPTPTPPAMVASVPFTPAPVQLDPLATPSPSPTSSPLIASNATPTPSPDADDQKAIEANEKELDRAAAAAGMKRPKEINTRPFTDLLAAAKKQRDEGKINLNGQIDLTVEADRDADGKLKNVNITGKADESLKNIAIGFIAALSDSGVLDFLEGTKHLRLIAKLDENTVEVIASNEADSIENAQKLERYLGVLIVGGRISARLKDKKDEEAYFNHTQVLRNEKDVSLKFTMPRAEMGAMLSKHASEK